MTHAGVRALSASMFEQALRDSHQQPVLVDFWAPWCAPCTAMAPALAGVAASLGAAVQVCTLDVDQWPEVAASCAVRSIPTLLLFMNGEPIGHHRGALHEHALHAWLGEQLQANAGPGPGWVAPDVCWGTFYGESGLRDFLLNRLQALAQAGAIDNEYGLRWDGRQGSVSAALVQHADPAVFERISGLPAGMACVLELAAPATPAQIRPFLSLLQAGLDLRQLPAQWVRLWWAEVHDDWLVMVRDQEVAALHLQWLQALDAQQAGNEPTPAHWLALRQRAHSLDSGERDPLRLPQDHGLAAIAALCPPPASSAHVGWSTVLDCMTRCQYHWARRRAGWTDEETLTEATLHSWFGERQKLEPGGRFSSPRLLQAHQDFAAAHPHYTARCGDVQARLPQQLASLQRAMQRQLQRLLATAPRVRGQDAAPP